MNNNLAVRSMLFDKTTGKLIKAVDERDLSDFLPLITEETTDRSGTVIFDFAPIIQYFHDELEKKLSQREHRDLTIKRATVFNTFLRLKNITNENFLFQSSVQVIRDSEEVLNWIYTRIPKLEINYYKADNNINQNTSVNGKTKEFSKLSDDIEVFIEILLCNIYATARVDVESFKSDIVIIEHCKQIRNLIFKLLSSELSYHNGRFGRQSLIYEICMENLGVNAEALICLLDSPLTMESINESILKNAITEDFWNGYEYIRKYSVSWPKSDENNLERVKFLSKLLERINLIIALIEELKNSEAYFENDSESQNEFESIIQKLLPHKKD